MGGGGGVWGGGGWGGGGGAGLEGVVSCCGVFGGWSGFGCWVYCCGGGAGCVASVGGVGGGSVTPPCHSHNRLGSDVVTLLSFSRVAHNDEKSRVGVFNKQDLIYYLRGSCNDAKC